MRLIKRNWMIFLILLTMLSLLLTPGCSPKPLIKSDEVKVVCGHPLPPTLFEMKKCLSFKEDYLDCIVTNVGNLSYDLNELQEYSAKLEQAVKCYEDSNKK
jgi:hypothetical protein